MYMDPKRGQISWVYIRETACEKSVRKEVYSSLSHPFHTSNQIKKMIVKYEQASQALKKPIYGPYDFQAPDFSTEYIVQVDD